MSRKRTENGRTARSNTGGKFGSDFKGFADVSLTSEALEEIERVKVSRELDLVAFIEECLMDGYKFSLTRNEQVKSTIATLTGRNGTGDNEGFALSGFGGTVEDSILALWGKHACVCHYGAWVKDMGDSEGQLPLWR